MSKLYIPAPGGAERDKTALSHELWVTVIISAALILSGWYFWVLPQVREPLDPLAYIEDVEEREALRDRQRFEAVLEGGRERISELDEEDPARVYELAPRAMTERLCEEQKALLGEGELPEEQVLALLESVQRRSKDAPWTCLVRQYLKGELREGEPLEEAVAVFWGEAEELMEHGGLLDATIEDFRESRDRPESERFYRWLRRCAMRGDYRASPACRRLLRQLSPAHGSELLEMISLHLSEGEPTREDILEGVQALGNLALRGQPASWAVLETAKLPDYDADLRLGAIFYLCRMVNSPDESILRVARAQLGRVAEFGGRPTNPHMTARWQRACRRAFGEPEDLSEPAPLLEVLVSAEEGDEGERGESEEFRVDYGLGMLVEAGVCEEEEGYPLWFCGAERWTGGRGSAQRALRQYIARTGDVEWRRREREEQRVWMEVKPGEDRESEER